MKIGARSDLFNCFGNDRYKKMKEWGMDYADYPVGDLIGGKTEEECVAMVLAEKALADEAGVIIHQGHGDWRWPVHDETEALREERAEAMRLSIRLAAMIGCKNWVVHPMMPFGPDDKGFRNEEFYQINLDFFRRLVAYAKEYDVTVCFENMPMRNLTISTTEKTLEFIHMINDDHFKLCLDTGHEAVFGNSIGDAIRLAGKDLQVFHIHDNDGKGDKHWFPGMGVIDWKDFMAALREIEFDGVLSLECSGCQQFFPAASDETRLQILKLLFDGIVNA